MTGLLTSNLLRRANQLIPPRDVVLTAWASKTLNDAGIDVPAYAAPVTIKANPQAVSRQMYEIFALDLQKNYLMLYASRALRDLQRDGMCDLIDYAGRRYNVESNTDWFAFNGWRGALLIDTGATPA